MNGKGERTRGRGQRIGGRDRVNLPKPQGQQQLVLVLQRELWVKLTDDTKLERGKCGDPKLYFYQSARG